VVQDLHLRKTEESLPTRFEDVDTFNPMSDAIITVENLSKKYLIGHRSGIRSRSNYIALRDVVGTEVRNIVRKTIDVICGRQVLVTGPPSAANVSDVPCVW
jgi:hypothetical protein